MIRDSRKRRTSGTTLVEMIVSLLLLELLMIMVIGVLSPAARIFVQLQRLQFSQMILDNVAEEMKAQMLDTVGSIRIYRDAGMTAGESGSILEFVNTDGYVVLMSADGCPDTMLIKGEQDTGMSGEQAGGRLLMRYYWPKIDATGGYTYTYTEGGSPVARSVNPVFTDKYYMGNYLRLEFSFPDGAAPDTPVEYVTAKVSLYSDEDCQTLMAAEDVILDIRYQTMRIDDSKNTAVAE